RGHQLFSVTYFILLSAAAGARFVAADFLLIKDRLFGGGGLAAYKLEIGQFALFLTLDSAGKIHDRVLSCPDFGSALFGRDGHGGGLASVIVFWRPKLGVGNFGLTRCRLSALY